MIFKRSWYFQFPEAVVTSTAKESQRSTERGSLQVLAVLCSEGKVMLLLSMVRYQVLLCYTDAIAINKICKLNFRYFTMYLTISQQHGYRGFFEYGVYFS